MGNEHSSLIDKDSQHHSVREQQSSVSDKNPQHNFVPSRPASNLTMLLNQHEQQQNNHIQAAASNSMTSLADEADSASGPPNLLGALNPNAPEEATGPLSTSNGSYIAAGSAPANALFTHQSSSGTVVIGTNSSRQSERVRRCMSSKELGTLAPPSGSPYAYMLYKKEQLETSMRQRLQIMRESFPMEPKASNELSDESSNASSRLRERSNEMRNRRRAQHNQAVVEDLCSVVADLFIAESKLLKPLNYGVPNLTNSNLYEREQVLNSIRTFISALPTRYALGADTPSEVLLHMRLMAAARAEKTKAVVHIHNLTDDSNWSKNITAIDQSKRKTVRLVTISCSDAFGLLEYITKLLATSGSRVLDADVMLSTDGIVLDRFVVEMNGRLRLDKLANLIESFLKERAVDCGADAAREGEAQTSNASLLQTQHTTSGPLYYTMQSTPDTTRDYLEEIESAIPLSEVLASSSRMDLQSCPPVVPPVRRLNKPSSLSTTPPSLPTVNLSARPSGTNDGVCITHTPERPDGDKAEVSETQSSSVRRRRQLVNRRASSNLDEFEGAVPAALDYVTIPNYGSREQSEFRIVPIIPFDELMLIETLGTGRVSTIYRAAWQRAAIGSLAPASVQMVALKVAMINHITGDTSHVDELRREADIAARLSHPNVCDLVGVAADHDCFCLAYEFCEGGSLLSLLSDTSRYYEYLPIALDIANGMAYLHSRNVIHRDLKPSNILLTRDHRAQISDFGMSVANSGQELTAETGTYRYMAPEVIRHESYSSNADVYSFGICLWQLITREVPFSTMTPIQAAYAVAEGRRPSIPESVPRRLQEIIMACWDQDSHRRPSFTYIAMALADYAKMAFSPANVGALTLQIANEMLATVEGNSNVNVDFSTHAALDPSFMDPIMASVNDSHHSQNVGLEIE